jgi:predicted RNA binding protein YcfA (HicA-like mRNA interferase family)
MAKFKENYVVAAQRHPIGVVLDIADYRKLLEELEELESIRAYDAAKASGDYALPFEQAVAEIESNRQWIMQPTTGLIFQNIGEPHEKTPVHRLDRTGWGRLFGGNRSSPQELLYPGQNYGGSYSTDKGSYRTLLAGRRANIYELWRRATDWDYGMSRLPTISPSLMVNFLKRMGFKKSRQRGSHIFFRHIVGRTATVPFHMGEDLGRGLTNKILHDMDVSREFFLAWLEKNKA